MKRTFRWIECGLLFIIAVAAVAACGGQAMPPPVAATNTPLPPAPTEAPTSTRLPTATHTPLPPPTETATSTPQPVATEAAEKPVATEAAEKPVAELAEAANQVYAQNSCGACHGANYEGGFATILVGLPAERIQSVTRAGDPEAGMPAFDQDAISDDELRSLAEFLSGLTLPDIGVELPPAVVDHLSQARDALQAGDQAAVETHLKEAQEAGADAPPGVQVTLKGLVESDDAGDGVEALLRQ